MSKLQHVSRAPYFTARGQAGKLGLKQTVVGVGDFVRLLSRSSLSRFERPQL